jgi:uncharacterized membrane protein YcaP (DUF421 family)
LSNFFAIDWESLLLPSHRVFELILRGTLVYLGLVVLLRLILKRETGAIGITDLLMVVLLAEAAQSALANDYSSISDGFVLILTVIFWNYTLDWLGYRFPAIQKFVHPPPLMLVKNGQLLRRNMRRELITEDELLSKLRQQGVDDLSEVKEAFMEGDGQISVVTVNGKSRGGSSDRERKL